MALINTWFFTKTIIDWDILRRGTTNKFRVVSVREYCYKKKKHPDGYKLKLIIFEDKLDYGSDKNWNKR